jgi:hypothetical protein
MIVHYTRTQVSNSHTASTTGLYGKHSYSNTRSKHSPVTVIVCSATLLTECSWVSPHKSIVCLSHINEPCERTCKPRLGKQTNAGNILWLVSQLHRVGVKPKSGQYLYTCTVTAMWQASTSGKCMSATTVVEKRLYGRLTDVLTSQFTLNA